MITCKTKVSRMLKRQGKSIKYKNNQKIRDHKLKVLDDKICRELLKRNLKKIKEYECKFLM